jgi:PAS domain S-box-containing protein
LSATIDWVSLVDRNYIYRIINQTYLNWYQKSWDEIVGHSVSEIVGVEIFQNEIKPNLDRCLTGEAVRYELQTKENSFGNPEFVSITYTPFRELNGEISGVVVNVRDVSALKQTEVKLRKSEQRWQLALKGSNDGIWDHDLITNKHFLSERCLEIAGYELEEIDTFDLWLSFIHPDDLLLLQNSLQMYLAKETAGYSVQYRIKTKDKSYRWVESKGIAIWDEAGNLVHMAGSITDITDRKQIRAELHQLNCELELKVNQRTEALRRSEAILQEAQAIAKLRR